MLRTTEGKLVSAIVKECRKMESINFEYTGSFDIEGNSSMYIDKGGITVHVEWSSVYVTLSEGTNSIQLPNYGSEITLSDMIERAAEILFWEHGMCV